MVYGVGRPVPAFGLSISSQCRPDRFSLFAFPQPRPARRLTSVDSPRLPSGQRRATSACKKVEGRASGLTGLPARPGRAEHFLRSPARPLVCKLGRRACKLVQAPTTFQQEPRPRPRPEHSQRTGPPTLPAEQVSHNLPLSRYAERGRCGVGTCSALTWRQSLRMTCADDMFCLEGKASKLFSM